MLLPSLLLAQHVTTTAAPDTRHPTATVDRVDLDTAGAGEDLAATLGSTPGVHARHTSYGQSATLTIRGSNARQVLVETDGVRLNAPFGAGFDLSTASGFDHAAIWRGAAATYRGSGALAGALELGVRHLPSAGARANATVTAGSHDTVDASAHVTVATDTTSARLGLAARRSDGDFNFTDAQGTRARRVNNDHERVGVFGSVQTRAGDAWGRATVFSSVGERGTPGLSEFQQQFAAARMQDAHTTAIVAAGLHDIVATERWSLDGSVRAANQARWFTYDNARPFLGSTPIHETTDSGTAVAIADLELWSDRSVGRVALDVRHETWRGSSSAARSSAGLGASWEQTIAERWLLVAAARGDLDGDARVALSPALGASFAASPRLDVRANLGRTFRTPNLDELYLNLESLRGDPNLNSERAWVADLGAAWRSDAASLDVTAFGRLVDHEILFLPVTAYLVQAQNVDGTWAAGVEAHAAARWRALRAELAYTWTHARFVEGGAPVPLTPAHDASAKIAAHTSWLRTWTGASLRGAITLDNFGTTRDGAHLFWDAGVDLLALEPVQLSFAARNILDDDTMVDAAQQPVPGRTLWVRMSATY